MHWWHQPETFFMKTLWCSEQHSGLIHFLKSAYMSQFDIVYDKELQDDCFRPKNLFEDCCTSWYQLLFVASLQDH